MESVELKPKTGPKARATATSNKSVEDAQKAMQEGKTPKSWEKDEEVVETTETTEEQTTDEVTAETQEGTNEEGGQPIEEPKEEITPSLEPQGGEQGGETPGPEAKDEETHEPEYVPTLPVPTDEEIQEVAKHLADQPEALEGLRKTLHAAEAIIAKRNEPAKLSPEDMAAINHQKLVEKYGKDFVRAEKGTNKTIFARTTWNNMSKDKSGWVEVREVMPEVAAAGETQS